ncbi:MAG TPA: hypothetical protein VFB29_13610 [Pseudolabrys sp.]|nr:hypothetical protein [Pseudolabrys sp.]
MRPARHALLLTTCLIASGCTAAPPAAGPDPADPDIRVPAATYRSSLREFRRAEPKEPAPWTSRGENGQP